MTILTRTRRSLRPSTTSSSSRSAASCGRCLSRWTFSPRRKGSRAPSARPSRAPRPPGARASRAMPTRTPSSSRSSRHSWGTWRRVRRSRRTLPAGLGRRSWAKPPSAAAGRLRGRQTDVLQRRLVIGPTAAAASSAAAVGQGAGAGRPAAPHVSFI